MAKKNKNKQKQIILKSLGTYQKGEGQSRFYMPHFPARPLL